MPCRSRCFTAVVCLAASVFALPVFAQAPPVPEATRRVNVPYREPGNHQPAIFWLGKVEPVTNYADVRVWYTDDRLHVALHIPDRELWYNPSSSQTMAQLMDSDAVSLFLDLSGNTGQAPSSSSYAFIKQFSSARGSYRGNGSGWASSSLTYTVTDAWRGSGPNNPAWDMGWQVTFEIPFATLGLSGPPAQGTLWGLGVAVHDRDDQASTPIPDQVWPEGMDYNRPSTWGQLRIGRPTYTPPTTTVAGTMVVRHGLNGAVVPDAAVGGHSTCGGTMNAWTEWGNANYAGYTQFNIQNQWDVADFMCFSKYYVTFPLDSLPADAAVIAARVTLHLFGNAGYTPSDAQRSAINALTIKDDWVESTITWNNAPLAWENVSVTWVYPVSVSPPGPYTWDVSYAVAEARRLGKPLRLVFYSTDGAYHSGKYFYTSDSNDWNGSVRPSLEVDWGAGGAAPAAPTNLRIVR
jgi:hypothetical protein